jgi:RNA polymerase sigma-70 factor (ECF subfamily)
MSYLGNSGELVKGWYHTHYIMLSRKAFSWLQNKKDAEDAIEDVFSKLIANLNENPEKQYEIEDIKAYLTVAVRNQCKSVLKARKKNYTFNSELQYYLGGQVFEESQAEILEQILQTFYAELANLPPQCRKVCTLAFIYHKKPNEIARLLNIDASTVGSQKAIGLNKIRTILIAKGLIHLLLFTYLFEE